MSDTDITLSLKAYLRDLVLKKLIKKYLLHSEVFKQDR